MAHVGVLKLKHLFLDGACLAVERGEVECGVALEHHHHRRAIVGKVLGLQEPGAQLAYKLLVALVGKQEVAGVLQLQTLGVDFAYSLLVALDGSLGNVAKLLALVASESVAVLSQVLVVEGEGVQGLGVGWQQGVDGLGPVLLVVVGLHVPSVVGNAVECYLRGLGVLHRVGHESRHVVGNVLAVAVGRTKEHVVSHEVAHGEVPPDVGLAVDAAVDPLHRLLVDAMHHAVASPHDAYVLVHLGAERAQVALLVVRPGAVVLSGAHDERRDVVVAVDEVVVDIVEQLSLLVGLCALAPDVVEEHGEGAYAEGVHHLKLVDEVVAVGVVPLYVDAGVYGPVEVHTVLLRHLVELLYALSLVGGVGLAPLVAVVGVVLRSVDVCVHLVASVELYLAQSRLVAPGRAVESLDGATEVDIGPVAHGAFLELALRH